MEPSLVLIGLDREATARLEPILAPLGLAAESFETAGEAAAHMAERRFRLAVCRYPLPDLTMADLSSTVIRTRRAAHSV